MIDFVKDIYDGVKTFMVGMKVTGGYLKDNMIKDSLGQPIDASMAPNTVDYDGFKEKALAVQVADRFRGHLHNDIERCIVCKNCAKACPIDCFLIYGEKNLSNKYRPSLFDIDILKCMYCGLCVVACPTGCLTMTKEWWGATEAGTTDTTGAWPNSHGLVRSFGVGLYPEDQKRELERKRVQMAEEKRLKAAEAAAKKPPLPAAAKPAVAGAPAAGAAKPATPAVTATPAASAAPAASPAPVASSEAASGQTPLSPAASPTPQAPSSPPTGTSAPPAPGQG